MISYDDFAKLEIKIGTIMSVEVVENADKLLCLQVDFAENDEDGNSKYRQIISGIREFFADPQDLVGRKCPFLTNLETRVIRGLESQGMILAASSETGFALLHPDRDIETGAKIR